MDKTLLENWESTLLLKGFPEEKKEDLAQILENQRVLKEEGNHYPQFMRISVPLVRRVAQHLLELNVPFTGNTETDVKKMKLKVVYMVDGSPESQYLDLDREAELCSILAKEIANEIAETFPEGVAIHSFTPSPAVIDFDNRNVRRSIILSYNEHSA